jgi:tetratricopeptide (TPR) repeat protein
MHQSALQTTQNVFETVAAFSSNASTLTTIGEYNTRYRYVINSTAIPGLYRLDKKGKVDMEQGVVYLTALLIALYYCYPHWIWKSGSKKHVAGDYDGAIRIFTRISKSWWMGKRWTAHSLVARAGARVGLEQYQLALEDCDQALRIEPINSIALATRGWCIWQSSENAALALIDVDNALILSPISATALAYKGAILLGSGSFEEAVTCFSNAVRLEPNKPYHYIQRAKAYSDLRQVEQALTDCDVAKKLAPKDGTLLAICGWIFQQLGKYDDAIEQCQQALELSPSSPTAISSFAAVLHQNNRSEEALAFLNKQSEDKHNQFHFRLNRAVFLTELLRYEEALVDCDIASTFKPSWRIHLCRAYIYLCQGKLVQCDLELKAAEALRPEVSMVISNRARWLVAMEKFQESVDLVKAFAEMNKSAELNHLYLNTEGIAHKALGELSSAETFFQRALNMNPKSLEALWHHGDTLERLGDLEKGHMEKSMAIESGYVERP